MTQDEVQETGPTGGAAQDSVLEPFLTKLASFLASCPDDGRPVSVSLGDNSFAMDSWERGASFQALCAKSGTLAPWQRSVAEGIAAHLAVMRSLAALRAAPPEGTTEAEEKLAAVVAAGNPITQELKVLAERAYADGDIELGGRLAAFRDRLAVALSQAWHAISGVDLTWEEVVEPPPAAPELPLFEAPIEFLDPPSAPVPESVVEQAPPVAEPAPPLAEQAPPVAEQAPPIAEQAPPASEEADALGPLLARARSFLRIRAAEDRPVEIRFGERRLKLTLWERRLLWRLVVEGNEPAHEWHRSIVEVVAFQLAILPQLEELERRKGDPQGLRAIAQELAKHLRIAGPLVEGLRVTMENLVARGQTENARHLTAFRSALADTVRDARRALLALAPREDAAADAGPQDNKPTFLSLAGVDPDLEPYYERAGRLLKMKGREDKPVAIPIGARAWQFTAWERGILWTTLCQEGIPGASWYLLASKCAVLQLAVMLEIEKLRQSTGDEKSRQDARHFLYDLVGRAQLAVDDLQADAERLDEDGQHDIATRLIELVTKINGTLQTVRATG